MVGKAKAASVPRRAVNAQLDSRCRHSENRELRIVPAREVPTYAARDHILGLGSNVCGGRRRRRSVAQ
jgi:hypothetical protein